MFRLITNLLYFVVDSYAFTPIECSHFVFIHSAVRLTRVPQSLPKRVLYRVRFSASQWLFTSSSSSPGHAYLSRYLSFNNVFWKAVPTNPVNLLSVDWSR